MAQKRGSHRNGDSPSACARGVSDYETLPIFPNVPLSLVVARNFLYRVSVAGLC